MFHYMIKAEFLTLVSLNVPSGYAYCYYHTVNLNVVQCETAIVDGGGEGGAVPVVDGQA